MKVYNIQLPPPKNRKRRQQGGVNDRENPLKRMVLLPRLETNTPEDPVKHITVLITTCKKPVRRT